MTEMSIQITLLLGTRHGCQYQLTSGKALAHTGLKKTVCIRKKGQNVHTAQHAKWVHVFVCACNTNRQLWSSCARESRCCGDSRQECD
jgi:hypothetical protein